MLAKLRVNSAGTMMYARVKTTVSQKTAREKNTHSAQVRERRLEAHRKKSADAALGSHSLAEQRFPSMQQHTRQHHRSALPYLNPWRPPTVTPVNSPSRTPLTTPGALLPHAQKFLRSVANSSLRLVFGPFWLTDSTAFVRENWRWTRLESYAAAKSTANSSRRSDLNSAADRNNATTLNKRVSRSEASWKRMGRQKKSVFASTEREIVSSISFMKRDVLRTRGGHTFAPPQVLELGYMEPFSLDLKCAGYIYCM
eukprot:SAG31_NODE_48_length_30945_cov_16.254263_8_plen_255_part_00